MLKEKIKFDIITYTYLVKYFILINKNYQSIFDEMII
jgi:hypothetical protein